MKATDPWAGRHIGIEFRSTVNTNLEGGYWDLDHVRLVEIAEPVLTNAAWTGGQFQCDVLSEPGLVFDVIASPDPMAPLSNWASVGTFTNTAGAMLLSVPAASESRFYGTRRAP